MTVISSALKGPGEILPAPATAGDTPRGRSTPTGHHTPDRDWFVPDDAVLGWVDGKPFAGYLVEPCTVFGDGHPAGMWVRERKPLPSTNPQLRRG